MTLRTRLLLSVVLALLSAVVVRGDDPMPRSKVVLVIHGGAGVIARGLYGQEHGAVPSPTT